MKLIKTEDAVGHVLCHDITQIIKGVTKDAVFRKGHVVKKEDIPVPPKTAEWLLVTYRGQGLGWCKHLGNRLNNYYPKEWRIRMTIE